MPRQMSDHEQMIDKVNNAIRVFQDSAKKMDLAHAAKRDRLVYLSRDLGALRLKQKQSEETESRMAAKEKEKVLQSQAVKVSVLAETAKSQETAPMPPPPATPSPEPAHWHITTLQASIVTVALPLAVAWIGCSISDEIGGGLLALTVTTLIVLGLDRRLNANKKTLRWVLAGTIVASILIAVAASDAHDSHHNARTYHTIGTYGRPIRR